MTLPPLPAGWRELLGDATASASFRQLESFLLQEERDGHVVLPPREEVFHAFACTPPDAVKVLLVGQDPYPTPGHAHGLCFSVRPEVRPLPRSLCNIYRELHDDLGCRPASHGHLESWARQGVLLLNTVLTVRARAANSHQGRGWEAFTDTVISRVAARAAGVVFVLWGNHARRKAALVQAPRHRIVACAHPSPLSARRFLGCRCFSAINRHLVELHQAPIDWELPDG